MRYVHLHFVNWDLGWRFREDGQVSWLLKERAHLVLAGWVQLFDVGFWQQLAQFCALFEVIFNIFGRLDFDRLF